MTVWWDRHSACEGVGRRPAFAQGSAGRRAALLALVVAAALAPAETRAGDMTAREVTTLLFRAQAPGAIDLSGRNLSFLDLSGLDFKSARLARADLYGVDFTGARLAGADLSRTRIDRAVLTRADLSGADLTGATLLRPTVFASVSFNLADAPRFAGAVLRDARLMTHIEGADFRGADLTSADLSPLEARPGQKAPSTAHGNVLKSCDFSGASLRYAKLAGATLTFSRFAGADFAYADLTEADLSRTDLTGADLTGANLTGADLDGAVLTGVRGLDHVVGWERTLNRDRVRW